jgi:phosphate transport system protein
VAPPALPEQLDQLADLLGRMCVQAAGNLRDASAGLLEGRLRLAEKLVDSTAMDGLRSGVEEVATDALLFHAPVAGDLRAVVSALHASDDLVRMGVLARHVAETALRRRPGTVPDEVRPAFSQMSRLGVDLALKAAEVVRTRNVLLAVELDADDEAMDALHARMFEVLMDRSWPHGVLAAVDVTLLARYYERFADHAVLVAGETVRAVTGRRPDEVATYLDTGS